MFSELKTRKMMLPDNFMPLLKDFYIICLVILVLQVKISLGKWFYGFKNGIGRHLVIDALLDLGGLDHAILIFLTYQAFHRGITLFEMTAYCVTSPMIYVTYLAYVDYRYMHSTRTMFLLEHMILAGRTGLEILQNHMNQR